MPAKSKSQQRLMGQAYAYKTGEIKAKDLNPKYADEIKKVAKSMTAKQLKDFAKTKHKKLPEKVDEVLKFSQFNEDFQPNDSIKQYLHDFVEWLGDCGEDAFYVFDNTDEAIEKFLKAY